jgi:Domain of unknown function (DUF1917)
VGTNDTTATPRGPRPSRVTKRDWVWVRAAGPRPGKSGGRQGKWLLYSPPDRHDANWVTIKQATKAGRLGCSAKAQTASPAPRRRADGDWLICVYTYDWQDKADVCRVLRELRALSFTGRLRYKTDAATLAGRSGGPGTVLYRSPPRSLDLWEDQGEHDQCDVAAGRWGTDVSGPDVAGETLEAFASGRSGCFRFVTDAAGRPAHCPKPPAWSGVFRDRQGRPYTVRACEDHRGGLKHARRLSGQA